MIPVGARIRPINDTSKDALRIGTGEVTAHEDGLHVVVWDAYGPALKNWRNSEQIAEVVMAACRYEPEVWKRGRKWNIEGAVLICHTHKAPTNGAAYDDIDTTERCRGPW